MRGPALSEEWMGVVERRWVEEMGGEEEEKLWLICKINLNF